MKRFGLYGKADTNKIPIKGYTLFKGDVVKVKLHK